MTVFKHTHTAIDTQMDRYLYLKLRTLLYFVGHMKESFHLGKQDVESFLFWKSNLDHKSRKLIN